MPRSGLQKVGDLVRSGRRLKRRVHRPSPSYECIRSVLYSYAYMSACCPLLPCVCLLPVSCLLSPVSSFPSQMPPLSLSAGAWQRPVNCTSTVRVRSTPYVRAWDYRYGGTPSVAQYSTHCVPYEHLLGVSTRRAPTYSTVRVLHEYPLPSFTSSASGGTVLVRSGGAREYGAARDS